MAALELAAALAEDGLRDGGAGVGETAVEDVQAAVVIDVDEGRREPGLVPFERIALLEPLAVDVVVKRGGAGQRAGDVEVDAAVAIVIAEGRADQVTVVERRGETVLGGGVAEVTAFVDEQLGVDPPSSRQTLEEGHFESPTGHEEVEVAVVVDVAPGGRPTGGDPPLGDGVEQPGGRRHVLELAATPVGEEVEMGVRADDEEVHETVAVVVSRGNRKRLTNIL